MRAFVSDPLDLAKLNPTDDLAGIETESAIGFLTCTPDLSFEEMLSSVTGRYPLPVVGGTTLGNPFEPGDDPFLARFSVMGKKNLRRHVAVSAPLTPENCREAVRNVHRECVEKLDGDVKLFVILLPLFPDLYIDYFLDELFECADGVPVFGGMMSDELHSTRSFVFADGAGHQNHVLLLALGGDIRPAFGSGCELTVPSDYRPLVTRAHDNIIERVDDIDFIEYLHRVGLDESAVKDLPVSVRVFSPDGKPGDPGRVAALTAIDAKTRSGTLSTRGLLGARVCLGYITRENIAASTNAGIDGLLADMARQSTDGYQYDIVLGVSCIARYYLLFQQENIEANLMAARLPSNLARFGFYAFGEVCPGYRWDGALQNRRMGKTLGLCAL